ncbi:MAG: hypothetical protein ACOX7F_00400 [Eubacteriales bacterium]|jgi:hypothetical protein
MKKWMLFILCGLFACFTGYYFLQNVQSSFSAADLQQTYTSPLDQQELVSPRDSQEGLVTPPPLAGQPQPPAEPRDLTLSIGGSEGSFTMPFRDDFSVEAFTQAALEEYPLLDFDYGRQGRWYYTINGQPVEEPAETRILQEGDSVVWYPVPSSGIPPA